MRKVLQLLLIAGMAGGLAAAAVLDSNTAGNLGTMTEFFGQSFTTPAGGPFNNIAFNFFSDIPPTVPSAGGTAFLLTQVYTGTPAALNSSTPGFVAQSTGVSGGQYLFSPSLTLQGSTKYFLYENASILTSGGNAITGGEGYFALTSTTNFVTANTPALNGTLQSANFVLTGNAVTAAVPEPATFGLLAMVFGLGGIATRLRRRT
jgi:hypothetical protein